VTVSSLADGRLAGVQQHRLEDLRIEASAPDPGAQPVGDVTEARPVRDALGRQRFEQRLEERQLPRSQLDVVT